MANLNNTTEVSDNTTENSDNNVPNLKREDTGTYDNTTEASDNTTVTHYGKSWQIMTNYGKLWENWCKIGQEILYEKGPKLDIKNTWKTTWKYL